MREYTFLGMNFQEEAARPPGHIMLEGRGRFDNLVIVGPLTLRQVNCLRTEFLSRTGVDVDNVLLSSVNMNQIEHELRRHMVVRETRSSQEPAPITFRASPSSPEFTPTRERPWPAMEDQVLFNAGSGHGHINIEADTRFVGGEGNQDLVRLRMDRIDISFLRRRADGEPGIVSRRKCRLELFRWLQRAVREEFDRHKNEDPEVEFVEENPWEGFSDTFARTAEALTASAGSIPSEPRWTVSIPTPMPTNSLEQTIQNAVRILAEADSPSPSE